MMVSDEVRTMFQVLTGEEWPDADEDKLRALADAWDTAAQQLGAQLAPQLAHAVATIRSTFHGQAEQAFAARMAPFVEGRDNHLAVAEERFRALAAFLRELALDVEYVKLVSILSLIALIAEIAWATAMAFWTAGASMVWLAARVAIVRFLLQSLLGRLLLRFAQAAVFGVAFQLVIDGAAQGIQFAMGNRTKWNTDNTRNAAGVGAMGAALGVPLNLGGGFVSKQTTKGLDDALGKTAGGWDWHRAVPNAVVGTGVESLQETLTEGTYKYATEGEFEMNPFAATSGAASGAGSAGGAELGGALRGGRPDGQRPPPADNDSGPDEPGAPRQEPGPPDPQGTNGNPRGAVVPDQQGLSGQGGRQDGARGAPGGGTPGAAGPTGNGPGTPEPAPEAPSPSGTPQSGADVPPGHGLAGPPNTGPRPPADVDRLGRPEDGRTTGGQQGPGTPAVPGDHRTTGRSGADRPGTGTPSPDAPTATRPSDGGPPADLPGGTTPRTDLPRDGLASADPPGARAPRADLPGTDAPVGGASPGGLPRTDGPSGGIPAADPPGGRSPMADTPAGEALPADLPGGNAQTADLPRTEPPTSGELPGRTDPETPAPPVLAKDGAGHAVPAPQAGGVSQAGATPSAQHQQAPDAGAPDPRPAPADQTGPVAVPSSGEQQPTSPGTGQARSGPAPAGRAVPAQPPNAQHSRSDPAAPAGRPPLAASTTDLPQMTPTPPQQAATATASAGATTPSAAERAADRPGNEPARDTISHRFRPAPLAAQPAPARDLRANPLSRDEILTTVAPQRSVTTDRRLGKDSFGDRRQPGAPEFTRGYDYADLHADKRAAFFDLIDMRNPAPSRDALKPRRLTADDTTVTTGRTVPKSGVPKLLRSAGSALQPLAKSQKVPHIVHSIWLGGPLTDQHFKANVAQAARDERNAGMRFVLWTDVTRAEVAAARGTPGTAREQAIADMLAWADNAGVRVVNVDEVFNQDNPMVYDAEARTERAQRSGARYAAASDIVRLEILNRFGGMYMDGDNVVAADLAPVFRAVADDPNGLAIGRTATRVTLTNSTVVAAAGSAGIREYLDIVGVNDGKGLLELFPSLDTDEFRERKLLEDDVRGEIIRRTGPFHQTYEQLAERLGVPEDELGRRRTNLTAVPYEVVNDISEQTWLSTAPAAIVDERTVTDAVKGAVQRLHREHASRDGIVHLAGAEQVISRLPEAQRPAAWEATAAIFLDDRPESIKSVSLHNTTAVPDAVVTAIQSAFPGSPVERPAESVGTSARPAPHPGAPAGGRGDQAGPRPAAPAAWQAEPPPATARYPEHDRYWERAPDRSAPWFARSNPLPPRAWASLRDKATVRTVDFEAADILVSSSLSKPKYLQGGVRYDVRLMEVEPNRLVQEYTIRIHLSRTENVTDDEMNEMEGKARLGVDSLFNQGYRLPSGPQLHVRLEFVKDPAAAHVRVTAANMNDADETTWGIWVPPVALAHEVGHMLGLPDEYRDGARATVRVFNSGDPHTLVTRVDGQRRVRSEPRLNSVREDDGGLMSDDQHSTPVVLPRHLWHIDRMTRSQVHLPLTDYATLHAPDPRPAVDASTGASHRPEQAPPDRRAPGDRVDALPSVLDAEAPVQGRRKLPAPTDVPDRGPDAPLAPVPEPAAVPFAGVPQAPELPASLGELAVEYDRVRSSPSPDWLSYLDMLDAAAERLAEQDAYALAEHRRDVEVHRIRLAADAGEVIPVRGTTASLVPGLDGLRLIGAAVTAELAADLAAITGRDVVALVIGADAEEPRPLRFPPRGRPLPG